MASTFSSSAARRPARRRPGRRGRSRRCPGTRELDGELAVGVVCPADPSASRCARAARRRRGACTRSSGRPRRGRRRWALREEPVEAQRVVDLAGAISSNSAISAIARYGTQRNTRARCARRQRHRRLLGSGDVGPDLLAIGRFRICSTALRITEVLEEPGARLGTPIDGQRSSSAAMIFRLPSTATMSAIRWSLMIWGRPRMDERGGRVRVPRLSGCRRRHQVIASSPLGSDRRVDLVLGRLVAALGMISAEVLDQAFHAVIDRPLSAGGIFGDRHVDRAVGRLASACWRIRTLCRISSCGPGTGRSSPPRSCRGRRSRTRGRRGRARPCAGVGHPLAARSARSRTGRSHPPAQDPDVPRRSRKIRLRNRSFSMSE